MVTFAEIKEAIDLCELDLSTTTLLTSFGSIEVDFNGFPVLIKLNPEAYETIKDLCRSRNLDKQNLVRVEMLCGLPVVVENDLKEEIR